MIPEFDDQGYLPPGVYPATIEEIADRFGRSSDLRRVQLESLRWLIEKVKAAGARRLIINGSFVTDALEPNDVDCIILIDEDFPANVQAEADIRQGFPFLEINLVEQKDFDVFVEMIFATDRFYVQKGMVEVIL
jgi:hypothetical protein